MHNIDKGNLSPSVWYHPIPYIPIREGIHCNNRSQAFGDNLEETSKKRTTSSTETIDQGTRIQMPKSSTDLGKK